MRVFVSSTALDLSKHRGVAQEVILQLGWQPVLFMEQRSVAAGPSVHACQDMVRSCEQFLLIVGHRCGWIPSKPQGGNGVTSITEIELQTWVYEQRRRHRHFQHPLIMMAADCQSAAPDVSVEDNLHRSCQTMFRERLKASGLLVNEFSVTNDPGKIPAALQEFRVSVTTLASKLRVATSERELRNAKGDAWLAAALGFLAGAVIFGSGGDGGDLD